MSKPKVVLSETLDPACSEWLSARAEVAWLPREEPHRLRSGLTDARGLVVRTYTRVDDALLAGAPGLKVVARAGVGLENIDVPACRRRGISVVYTPDANTQAVVEYLLLLLLGHFRSQHWLATAVPGEEWDRLRVDVVGERQLSELTLGILGVGRIGSRVASVAHALGMRVIAHDLLPREVIAARVDFPLEQADPERVLAEADVLTLHADGRPSNRGLLGRRGLELLRPGCLIVNTARGMLVDAPALADWARRNAARGGAALLDVHDPEPFGADYPLLGLPNVRLAPHLASRTRTALRNMSWVVKDVVEVLEGRPPRFPAPELDS